MNFAEIENVWRSPRNRPTPAETEKQKMEFITELRRRRRSTAGLLTITALPLAFITGKLLVHLISPRVGLDALDLSREWGVLPFFALPWAAWLMLLRQHLRDGRKHRDYSKSVSASVSALLTETRARRRLNVVVAALLVLSALTLPLIVHQLRAVGKAGDEILLPAYGIYPAYVIAMVTWLVWHDRRKLKPRHDELQALLMSYR